MFRNGKPEEMGQLCFELMKMTTGSDYLSREHITIFTEKLVNLNEQYIQTFYAKTEFDPRLPIKKGIFKFELKILRGVCFGVQESKQLAVIHLGFQAHRGL